LTGGGLVLANIDNAHESFGGDIRIPLIGSIICALAYEYHSGMTVALFAECLMPQLFDTASVLTDALRDQLVTETNLQLILNEGAARGLNDLSCKGSRVWASRWKIRVGVLRSCINKETVTSSFMKVF
jgi:hypothetical protein